MSAGQSQAAVQNLYQAVIVKAGDAGGKLNLVLPKLVGIFPGQRGSSGKLAQRGEHQTAHLSIRALESLAWAGAALPQSGAAGLEERAIVGNRAGVA